jgi:hypothetical protein
VFPFRRLNMISSFTLFQLSITLLRLSVRLNPVVEAQGGAGDITGTAAAIFSPDVAYNMLIGVALNPTASDFSIDR